MDTLFLKPLNMSIAAGWLILVVMVLRIVLKKAPKYIRCILWGVVAIRLICPISFESVFSLIPSKETLPPEALFATEPVIQSGVEIVDKVVNPAFIASFSPPDTLQSANPLQIWIALASCVWIFGMAVMLIYAVFSYFCVRVKLLEAIKTGDNIWCCDHVETPFILGILRPRIYLPSDMAEEDKQYVIAHEQAHIKRGDHWWKPLGYVLLTVYWFHPLCWIGYRLLCRDIELACDEKVIKSMDVSDKKAYSKALLTCSIPRHMISACPLAFGEVSVKERVKSVMNYKKPTFWFSIVAIIICAVAALCFLTDPKEETRIEIGVELQPIMGYTAEVPDVVLTYAKEYIYKDIENLKTKGYGISEAKIIGMGNMAPINISTTDDFYIQIYSLQYRLKPDDIEKVAKSKKRPLEGGWITCSTDLGEPYITLLCYEETETGKKHWEQIGDFRTKELSKYMTDESKSRYASPYQAIAMEMYHAYLESMSIPRAALMQREFDTRETLNWTLYLEDGMAWKTYQTHGDSNAEKLEAMIHSEFKLRALRKLPEDVGEYWIIVSQVDGKSMTFYPHGDGIIAYFDGFDTTYWTAEPSNINAAPVTGMTNIAAGLRAIYDIMEISPENMEHGLFVYYGNAEEAADYFGAGIYGVQLQNLAPGNRYRILEYNSLGTQALQVSEDGNKVLASVELAFVPADLNAPGLWDGNTRKGTGTFEGRLIRDTQFVLQKQEDGRWKCIAVGTECSLPE